MDKRFRITLSQEERQDVEELTRRGEMNVRALKRAWIVLKADEGPAGPAWSDGAIARALDVHPNTVLRLRRRYVAQGLAAVLRGRYTGHNPALVTGVVEAHLVTLACSAPPEGHDHWTLQLLADRLVVLGLVAHVSDETVRQALKKRTQAVVEAAVGHSAPGQRRLRQSDGRHLGRVSGRVWGPPATGVHG